MIRKSLNHLSVYDRIHMTDNIITEIDFDCYTTSISGLEKPIGFWYSINTQWIEWVKIEMPHWEKPYLYEIHVNKNRIIQIHNFQELMEFLNKYEDTELKYGLKQLHWDDVAKDYAGIEFLNYRDIKYNYDYGKLPLWFTCIDISSGCIWDKSGLNSFTLINEKNHEY